MGEVSEEIELDLGLSIGRSFKPPEKTNPDSTGNGGAREVHAPPSTVDPRERREIHALRRQEAKRKREEKRRRSGDLVSDDEKGRSGARVGEVPIEARGEEIDSEEGQCEKKKNKIEDGSTNPNSNQMQFPIVQVQFPYPPIQYVPLSNGFAIPYAVPCWAANGSAPAAAGGGEKQVACRSFVPFQANVGLDSNPTNGCESEQNGSGGIRRAASNGSPMCSSSVVSDNRSSSHEGVNSGETRSHTSHSRPDQPQRMTDGAQMKFEHSPSSNILQATQSSVKAIQNEKAAAVSNMSLHSNPAAPNRETNGQKHVKKPAASNITQSSTPVTEVQTQVIAPETQTGPAKTKPVSEGETGKPSKPEAQNPCLLQMPCVSTTGNGPNGKTVTGFLYRYTNAEVSIVCVCHGSSFSPAEFVAHAGGTDVSNPLRHITVIPSALG